MSTVSAAPTFEEHRLLQGLRAGDESAFATLLERYHTSLVRLAMSYVRDRAVAEEVAQETWLGVLRGLESFRGDSSLKTWIFRILTNIAKTKGIRESRSIPFSALSGDSDEPSVGAERFLDASHPQWPGHWASPPSSWAGLPEDRLAAGETRDCIRAAIGALPPVQRQVISLRDIEGWSSEEVCSLLDLTEANQRVLLHRARSKVRTALEVHLTIA